MAIAVEDLGQLDFSDVADGDLAPVPPGEILAREFLEPLNLKRAVDARRGPFRAHGRVHTAAVRRLCRGRQRGRRLQLAAIEVLHQRTREHPVPALQGTQLLRSSAQGTEEARDLAAGRPPPMPPRAGGWLMVRRVCPP